MVLRKSDKEILRGEKGESDFQDFPTRQSQIRTRVRRRSEALAEEVQLLREAGEGDIAEELLQSVCGEAGFVVNSRLHMRLKVIERELDDLERRYGDIERLKAEIESIQEQLAD